MLADDQPALDAWGEEIHLDDAVCEDCGRSVIGRFGGLPDALCLSCQSDQDRILSDPNTRWIIK